MRRAALLLSCALLAACRPGEPRSGAAGAAPYDPKQGLPGAVEAYFSLDPTSGFFDQPWPSDLRVRPGGRVDVERFPGQGTFFQRYTSLAAQTLTGASLSPTIYVRFTGPVPDAAVERGPGAPVFLVDIDPASPERGVYWPLTLKRSMDGARHVASNTLQVRVAPGFVLRPSTRYALVVRRSLTSPPLGVPLSFEATKGSVARSDPREEQARQVLGPVHEALAALGVARDDVASVAAFRTHEPRAFTRSLLAHAAALQGDAAPRLLWARWEPSLSLPRGPTPYQALTGVYCTPNYQQRIEQAPFLQGGGHIAVDQQGQPVLAPMKPGHPSHDPECGPLMRAGFVMTVPMTPPPPEGYPLVVSAHGTGGDARSFLGSNDFAGWAALHGLAVVSTDQPLHGPRGPAPRPGSSGRISLGVFDLLGIKLPFELDAPMLFYNPLNPAAARDNLRQATVDAATLVRLFAGLDLGAGGRFQAAPGAPPPPRLHPGGVLLAGHSQGSQSLSVLGALDPRVRGVVLSGCGGDTRYGVLANKEFGKFRGVAEGMLGMAPDELDEYHPFLALVQALSDPIDPQTYASLYRSPPAGLPPRSLLHVEGLGDGYTPNISAEALAIALHAAPVSPQPRPIAALAALGLRPAPEVAGNIASGSATLAFVQVAPTHNEDGHFVIYYEPPLGDLIGRFFADVSQGRTPRVRFLGLGWASCPVRFCAFRRSFYSLGAWTGLWRSVRFCACGSVFLRARGSRRPGFNGVRRFRIDSGRRENYPISPQARRLRRRTRGARGEMIQTVYAGRSVGRLSSRREAAPHRVAPREGWRGDRRSPLSVPPRIVSWNPAPIPPPHVSLLFVSCPPRPSRPRTTRRESCLLVPSRHHHPDWFRLVSLAPPPPKGASNAGQAGLVVMRAASLSGCSILCRDGLSERATPAFGRDPGDLTLLAADPGLPLDLLRGLSGEGRDSEGRKHQPRKKGITSPSSARLSMTLARSRGGRV